MIDPLELADDIETGRVRLVGVSSNLEVCLEARDMVIAQLRTETLDFDDFHEQQERRRATEMESRRAGDFDPYFVRRIGSWGAYTPAAQVYFGRWGVFLSNTAGNERIYHDLNNVAPDWWRLGTFWRFRKACRVAAGLRTAYELGYDIAERSLEGSEKILPFRSEPPASIDYETERWIEQHFAGHGVAIRRESDPPIPGEPFMSMADAKQLMRQAITAMRDAYASQPDQAETE
jgi:hypothetical protein